MITDPIADAFTRIRNAQRAGHHSVDVRGSKLVSWVLDVLSREGFIDGYEQKKETTGISRLVTVKLKYGRNGQPGISKLRRVSGPGRRVYRGLANLPRVQRGLGIVVLSTSMGIMSDREARKRRLGGEVIGFVS